MFPHRMLFRAKEIGAKVSSLRQSQMHGSGARRCDMQTVGDLRSPETGIRMREALKAGGF